MKEYIKDSAFNFRTKVPFGRTRIGTEECVGLGEQMKEK